MKFTVVTLLPELIEPSLAAGVVGRAREAGVIEVATVNPREFTSDKHRTVDDNPYGGGPGMVMKPEPLLAAIAAAGPGHRVLLSPAGRPLTQARVKELAKLPHVVLVCGRYEGVDERVIALGIDEEISIGDYVLSGGELGALVVLDACARLVPGVLGEPTSADDESHSAGLLEYPQYTRPAELDGLGVPAVLSSGNHAVIAAWRRAQALERTAARRPDLLRRYRASKSDAKSFPPLCARTHVALVHYPVRDRLGAIVTSALTNFDIHDLARSSLTYGLAGYHIVTPITSQREKAEHIARAWSEAEQAALSAGDPAAAASRARALDLVRTAASIEEVIAAVTALHGQPPRVVATSASAESFPGIPHVGFDALVAEAAPDPAPMLILLGTGWGLVDEQIPSVSRVLAPIEGPSSWNHLSVRSAAAIILDRLFGRPT
jgi:tRNA (guanine37-N1)-methyltransferase